MRKWVTVFCCQSVKSLHLYQRVHFLAGVIADPAGQLKAFPKASKLLSGTLTRYLTALCTS